MEPEEKRKEYIFKLQYFTVDKSDGKRPSGRPRL
jgi:hypothetical protein